MRNDINEEVIMINSPRDMLRSDDPEYNGYIRCECPACNNILYRYRAGNPPMNEKYIFCNKCGQKIIG